MKPRSPIARASKKVIAANGGKIPFSSISPSSGKGVKRVNTKRRKSEFARCYHSKERVLFVKSLPCVACLMSGHSENAHLETDGIGRKAHYTRIVPLCGDYLGDKRVGCHRMYDERRDQFERWFGLIDLEAAAARCEAQWRESQA